MHICIGVYLSPYVYKTHYIYIYIERDIII